MDVFTDADHFADATPEVTALGEGIFSTGLHCDAEHHACLAIVPISDAHVPTSSSSKSDAAQSAMRSATLSPSDTSEGAPSSPGRDAHVGASKSECKLPCPGCKHHFFQQLGFFNDQEEVMPALKHGRGIWCVDCFRCWR